MRASVAALYIYPVKSLRGIPLSSSELGPQGLLGDRQWMVVDANGTMVTQRQAPKMARISTKIIGTRLFLEAEGLDAIELTLPPHAQITQVSIWKDTCPAARADEHVNAWLNTALPYSSPLSLVAIQKRGQRHPGPGLRFRGPSKHFADAAPLLVVSTASLARLNAVLEQENRAPVDIQRFRPNLVLDCDDAFHEHHFRYLKRADGSRFLELVDHCERCAIITIDPDTGTRDAQQSPIATLVKLNPMPDKPAPAFGVNAQLYEGLSSGFIRVGESLIFGQ